MNWNGVRRIDEEEVPNGSELVSIWTTHKQPGRSIGIVTKKFAIEGTGLERIATFWVIPPNVTFVPNEAPNNHQSENQRRG